MSDFISQFWRAGQLVKATQMNTFYNNTGQQLSGYFNVTPCVCSGVSIAQTGTTNTITWTDGVVRFEDQTNPNSTTEPEVTMANIVAGTNTITCPVSGTQKYIVAILTITVGNYYDTINTATISATSLTLAEIAAQSNPLAYIPIRAITNNGDGTYSIFKDANCAKDYNQVLNGGVQSLNGLEGVISLLEGLGIDISVSGNDITLSVLPASTTQVGGVELATDAEAIARTDTERALVAANIAALFPNLAQSGNNINIGLTSSNPIIQTVNGNTRATMPNAGTTDNSIATLGDVNAVGSGFKSLATSNLSNNGLMLTGGIPDGSLTVTKVLVTQFLLANIGDVPSGGTSYTFTLMQSILTSNFPRAIIPVVFDSTGTVWCGVEGLTIVASNITQVEVFLRETSNVTQTVGLGLYVVGYKLP